MKTVKLSKAEQALFLTWRQEGTRILNEIGSLINNDMNNRLKEMALDKGIDLANEDWQFNQETFTFTLVEKPKEVPPSGKADAKKSKKVKSKKNGD